MTVQELKRWLDMFSDDAQVELHYPLRRINGRLDVYPYQILAIRSASAQDKPSVVLTIRALGTYFEVYPDA